MNFKSITAVVLGMLLLSLPFSASDEQFLFLSTSRTSTMNTELNETAEKGYRLMFASGLSGEEIGAMMEKLPEGSESYAYRLLSTTRTGTMQKNIDEAASEGFRVHPLAFTTKESRTAVGTLLTRGGTNTEIITIMERAPNHDGREYEYKFLATNRTGTLQREISEAVNDGYVLVAFGSRGEHMAIMERVKK